LRCVDMDPGRGALHTHGACSILALARRAAARRLSAIAHARGGAPGERWIGCCYRLA
jgi:hypothetical protein